MDSVKTGENSKRDEWRRERGSVRKWEEGEAKVQRNKEDSLRFDKDRSFNVLYTTRYPYLPTRLLVDEGLND